MTKHFAEKSSNVDQSSMEEMKSSSEVICGVRIKTEPLECDLVSGNSHQMDQNCDANNNENRNIKSDLECKTVAAKKLLSVIRKGDFQELLSLLSSKPDLNVFVNGQTALHYCLLLGRDVSWCQQLVSNGANPNLSNQDGWHPIHLAAFNGLHESLTYLITCNSKSCNVEYQ